MIRHASILALSLLVTMGCAKLGVYVEVAKDGSWTREDTFHASAGTGMGGPEKKIEDYFELPSGEGWTTSREEEGKELVFRATRRLALGEVLKGDIQVNLGRGRRVTNEVTVRRTAPDRIEYVEVLRWEGERKVLTDEPLEPEDIEKIRKILPEKVATEENARELGLAIREEALRFLFDPADPLFSHILTHPDLIERQLKRRIPPMLDEALLKKFGDALTQEERAEIVRRALEASNPLSKASPEANADPAKSEESKDDLVPMSFYLVPPGKVIETNGKLDPLTGDVYWAIFPWLVEAHGTLELRALCEAAP